MTQPKLRELLVCPRCRGALDGREALTCGRCGAEYPSMDGIWVLTPPELRAQDAEREGSLVHKTAQAGFFDQDPGNDFGVTRPRGAPAFHEALLRDKFRRSVVGIRPMLPGSTALVVCGGSGLDAEFLTEAGAHVIVSDISLGVLRQAQERSRRFGLGFELVVADAEALPFADRSVDIAYVHDGLHHLEHPRLAVAEMARVARTALSVSEPARSAASAVAVRLNVAESREEAGNPVRRFTLHELVTETRRHGYVPIRPHRYAMFYRHEPGSPMRLLSHPVLLPVAKRLFALGNRALGRFGNKLTVQARRSDDCA